MEKPDEWQRAIASVQLDKFKDHFTKNKADNLLEELSSDEVKIIGFIEPNLIVFEKRDCDFAHVGKRIEDWLLNNFKLKEYQKAQ